MHKITRIIYCMQRRKEKRVLKSHPPRVVAYMELFWGRSIYVSQYTLAPSKTDRNIY